MARAYIAGEVLGLVQYLLINIQSIRETFKAFLYSRVVRLLLEKVPESRKRCPEWKSQRMSRVGDRLIVIYGLIYISTIIVTAGGLNVLFSIEAACSNRAAALGSVGNSGDLASAAMYRAIARDS
jgi:hypothetical protein